MKYEITMDGKKMSVTLAEFRAELDRRRALAAPIMNALRAGDIGACAKAQADMRARA